MNTKRIRGHIRSKSDPLDIVRMSLTITKKGREVLEKLSELNEMSYSLMIEEAVKFMYEYQLNEQAGK